jgi:hypothetical protein
MVPQFKLINIVESCTVMVFLFLGLNAEWIQLRSPSPVSATAAATAAAAIPQVAIATQICNLIATRLQLDCNSLATRLQLDCNSIATRLQLDCNFEHCNLQLNCNWVATRNYCAGRVHPQGKPYGALVRKIFFKGLSRLISNPGHNRYY